MTTFLIDTADASLELSQLDEPYFFLATLRAPEISGSAKVDAVLIYSLGEFFEDLAANWKGWEGKKDWRTIEGELKLTATSDHLGHTFLEVILRNGSPATWTLQTEIIIDAGSLERLAKQARRFEAVVARAA